MLWLLQRWHGGINMFFVSKSCYLYHNVPEHNIHQLPAESSLLWSVWIRAESYFAVIINPIVRNILQTFWIFVTVNWRLKQMLPEARVLVTTTIYHTCGCNACSKHLFICVYVCVYVECTYCRQLSVAPRHLARRGRTGTSRCTCCLRSSRRRRQDSPSSPRTRYCGRHGSRVSDQMTVWAFKCV